MVIPAGLLANYLTKGLGRYDGTYYGPPEENLWGATNTYFPVSFDLTFGEALLQTMSVKYIGEGRAGSGASYDIPLVAIDRQEGAAIVEYVYAGAEWSFQEVAQSLLRAAFTRRANYDFLSEQVLGVATIINRRIHRLVVEGLPERGFGGVINNSRVSVVDLTATVDLGSMTGSQKLAWLQAYALNFSTVSKVPLNSIYMYVGLEVYQSLITPFSDTNPMSVANLMLETKGLSVGGIEYIPELSHAVLEANGVFTAGDNKNRILMGTLKDRSAVTRHAYALDRTPVFPKFTGLHFGISGYAASTEVDFKKPAQFAYVDVKVTPKP